MMRIPKPSLPKAPPASYILRSSIWSRRIPQLSPYSTDTTTKTTRLTPHQVAKFNIFKTTLSHWQASPIVPLRLGTVTWLDGFLVKKRSQGANLAFFQIQLNDEARSLVQVVSSWQRKDSPEHLAHQLLKTTYLNSPVSVRVEVQKNQAVDEQDNRLVKERFQLRLNEAVCLNHFPKDIIVSKDAVWPLKSRHLRMRFDPILYERLRFRDSVASLFRRTLESHKFNEVETPLLFKSTPEGAREYLVPTRQKGFAYALPQSPQQYKQILMAGGFPRYYQFARCFRDEDHRADRQPEFTQLDLEMAFASGYTVMELVESLIKTLSDYMHEEYTPTEVADCRHPKRNAIKTPDSPSYDRLNAPLMRLPYDLCMRKYGTDKPDLRIKLPYVTDIINAANWFSPSFKSMVTSLEDPIVELCKFRFTGSLEQTATFIREFFDELPKTTHRLSGDSTPGVFIYDTSKPLNGLSALEHEGAEKLTGFTSESWTPLENGDVVIVHARKNLPTQGSSTELGRMRKLIYDAAVTVGMLPKDNSFQYLWVTEFPLFTANTDEDPGQGGLAGFSSTHHPFTSPLTAADFDLLATNPLRAKADHYDLVLNGVEVGGGSRRIHVAEVQRYVMSDVLKMPDDGVAQFAHLLDALHAGCPPHAGFAMGFDRLLSVLCDVPTVRAVIAFPKNNKMQDQLVGSPSRTTPSQQKTYHLLSDQVSNSITKEEN